MYDCLAWIEVLRVVVSVLHLHVILQYRSSDSMACKAKIYDHRTFRCFGRHEQSILLVDIRLHMKGSGCLDQHLWSLDEPAQ